MWTRCSVNGRAVGDGNGLEDETESPLGDLFAYSYSNSIVECQGLGEGSVGVQYRDDAVQACAYVVENCVDERHGGMYWIC